LALQKKIWDEPVFAAAAVAEINLVALHLLRVLAPPPLVLVGFRFVSKLKRSLRCYCGFFPLGKVRATKKRDPRGFSDFAPCLAIAASCYNYALSLRSVELLLPISPR